MQPQVLDFAPGDGFVFQKQCRGQMQAAIACLPRAATVRTKRLDASANAAIKTFVSKTISSFFPFCCGFHDFDFGGVRP